ncbi:MAG: sigma-54 dependent transcriptional regulator [Acidobacteriota bacterium]
MRIAAYTNAPGESLAFWAAIEGASVREFSEVERLAGWLGTPDEPDVIAVRLKETDLETAQMLARVHQVARGIPVVAWVCEISAEAAFRISYLGANALVTDQATVAQRESAVETALTGRVSPPSSGNRWAAEPWRQHLVGDGSSMRVVCELIRLISPRKCTVLVTGETGTGKEMVARAIHAASPRAMQPMVSINCNAIPSELLESELFGHVKGAYTGAMQSRIGRFEQANRGTLFLDEVGDLPFHLQAKLLRVLQEREINRVGSSETVKVDVRIIAATNVNLRKLVDEGKFRQDLYYRLHVAPIHLPPLRERREDVPLLARHFVQKICRSEQLSEKSISPEIIDWLQSMPWTGNIRELENTIESAAAMSGDHPALRMSDFPALLGTNSQQPHLFAVPSDGIDYNSVVGHFERTLLDEALRMASGNKKRAASLLQLKRTTFYAKLDSLGIGKGAAADDDVDEYSSPNNGLELQLAV